MSQYLPPLTKIPPKMDRTQEKGARQLRCFKPVSSQEPYHIQRTQHPVFTTGRVTRYVINGVNYPTVPGTEIPNRSEWLFCFIESCEDFA